MLKNLFIVIDLLINLQFFNLIQVVIVVSRFLKIMRLSMVSLLNFMNILNLRLCLGNLLRGADFLC